MTWENSSASEASTITITWNREKSYTGGLKLHNSMKLYIIFISHLHLPVVVQVSYLCSCTETQHAYQKCV
jgi:hypothetical protein